MPLFPDPLPTLGRVVHYVPRQGAEPEPRRHYTALISRVDHADRGVCTLHVFDPTDLTGSARVETSVPFSDVPYAGASWHYPERA